LDGIEQSNVNRGRGIRQAIHMSQVQILFIWSQLTHFVQT